MNTKPLIKLACTKIFGDASGLVDMQAQLVQWLGLPADQNAALKSDLQTLRAWTAGWAPKDLARAAKADSDWNRPSAVARA